MALTTQDKIKIISECNEIMMAVKMLIFTMDDADLQNHITLNYELNNQNYELKFTKLNP